MLITMHGPGQVEYKGCEQARAGESRPTAAIPIENATAAVSL